MDLTSPLGSLVRTRDAAVLEALAGTEGALSMSGIWRLGSPGSRQGLYPVVDRLVEHGLVLAEKTDHLTTYRLNRDHLLAPSVLSAVAARRELFARLRAEMSKLEPRPVYAAIYGSVARRESRPDSDIDLCVVLPDDVDTSGDMWSDQIHKLEDRVFSWTGNRLEYLVLTVSDLERIVSEPVIASIRTEAVSLVGTSLDDLLPALVDHP